MDKPFLFRYKEPCSTKPVVSGNVFFDPESGMSFVYENNIAVPVIDSHAPNFFPTKKASMETGEDQSDVMYTGTKIIR